MNEDERKQYFMHVFHPVSELLSDAAQQFVPEATRPATLHRVETFKQRFSGQGSPSLPTLEAKWTPQVVVTAFTEFADILDDLRSEISDAGRVADDVRARLSTQQSVAEADQMVTLDRFLVEFIGGKFSQVEFAFWKARREKWRQRADVSPFIKTHEHILEEVRLLYTHVRPMCSNDDVIGALIEEFVRSKIASLVFPLQVSNGAIYGLPDPEQIDGIIWERQLGLPAVEVGTTAIVAPHAVHGIVEVKASCDSDLAGFGQRIMRLVAKGSALQDIMGTSTYPRATGLIVWSDKSLGDVLTITRSAAVSLFQRVNGELRPNLEGMLRFTDFLSRHVLLRPVPHIV